MRAGGEAAFFDEPLFAQLDTARKLLVLQCVAEALEQHGSPEELHCRTNPNPNPYHNPRQELQCRTNPHPQPHPHPHPHPNPSPSPSPDPNPNQELQCRPTTRAACERAWTLLEPWWVECFAGFGATTADLAAAASEAAAVLRCTLTPPLPLTSPYS